MRPATAVLVLAAAWLPLAAAQGPEPATLLESGSLQRGDAFTFSFTVPGTYDYICRPHPYMVGRVVVDANAAPRDLHVAIANYAYRPDHIVVGPSSNVTWTNEDDVMHTVTRTDARPVPGGLPWVILAGAAAAATLVGLVVLARRNRR